MIYCVVKLSVTFSDVRMFKVSSYFESLLSHYQHYQEIQNLLPMKLITMMSHVSHY